MGLLRSLSIPGAANGICCSRPAELQKRHEVRPVSLGAPDPVLGTRTGGPVADCLFARLNDNAVRRRHRSRLSSRPGRAQTSEVRIQSPRRVASHSHGFRPDRRPLFHSRRPGAGKPVHRLRSTPARLRDAVAGDRGRGGQRVHCEIRRPLARDALGLASNCRARKFRNRSATSSRKAHNGFSTLSHGWCPAGPRCSIFCRS